MAERSPVEAVLEQGVAALRAGQPVHARQLLVQAVRLEPSNERAWLWLAGAVATDAERKYCLRQVLRLNPDNPRAQQGIARLPLQLTPRAPLGVLGEAQSAPASPAPASPQEAAPPPPASRDWWMGLFGLMPLFACVLVLITLGVWLREPIRIRMSPPCPAGSVERYVALGSEATVGLGASNRGQTSYVALIGAELRADCPRLRVVNLGRTTGQATQILDLLPRIEGARPQLVTLYPVADYTRLQPDTFEERYGELLDALGGMGAHVFLGDHRIEPTLVCGSSIIASDRCYSSITLSSVTEKNRVVAGLARSRPWVSVVPIPDTSVAHPNWMTEDGKQPNDQGHADIAQRFLPAIESWLARQQP